MQILVSRFFSFIVTDLMICTENKSKCIIKTFALLLNFNLLLLEVKYSGFLLLFHTANDVCMINVCYFGILSNVCCKCQGLYIDYFELHFSETTFIQSPIM